MRITETLFPSVSTVQMIPIEAGIEPLSDYAPESLYSPHGMVFSNLYLLYMRNEKWLIGCSLKRNTPIEELREIEAWLAGMLAAKERP